MAIRRWEGWSTGLALGHIWFGCLVFFNGPMMAWYAGRSIWAEDGVNGHGWVYWASAAIVNATVGLSGTVFVRRRVARSRATMLGLCRTCGYDLRGSPGQCPECGTVAVP